MDVYYDIDYETLIYVDSPLFDIVSKTKTFEKYYKIILSQEIIDDYNLKEDYITIFNKLNKSNNQYPSLIYIFDDSKKIKYLKEFNINFKKIKKFALFEKNNEYINIKYKNFFNTLFSFNNIKKNLEYLKIYVK